MANEYRVLQAAVETATSGASRARLLAGCAEVALTAPDDRANIRLYQNWLETYYKAPDPITGPKIAQNFFEVHFSVGQRLTAPDVVGVTGPLEPSWLGLFQPDFVPIDPATWAPYYEQTAAPTTAIEANPFRPDIPHPLAETDPELYEYLREQAETLRNQHNLTQAGDTTFPWELSALASDRAEFTLGSMTRFVHETSGLLSGRFVQFGPTATAPRSFVGHDAKGVEWSATNDATRTSLWRPLGYTMPTDGNVANRWGWVLTEGRVPFAVTIESDFPLSNDQFVTWVPDSPAMLRVGPGPIVAQILFASQARETTTADGASYSPRRWLIPAFAWAIKLGGFTPEFIDLFAAARVDALRSEIDAIRAAIAALESQDYAGAISALQKQQTLLGRQLALESEGRNNTDAALNAKIETLNQAVRALQRAGAGPGGTTDLTEITNLINAVARAGVDNTNRIQLLEAWRVEASNAIAGLLASADQPGGGTNSWTLAVDGTGVAQAIELPFAGLTVEQVGVWINGLKWSTTEYTILEQTLTITSNAAGDKIELIGL